MNLGINKSPLYHADVTSQFGWYFNEAGEELALRFFNATDQTLYKLARQPDLGRRRKFRHPGLMLDDVTCGPKWTIRENGGGNSEIFRVKNQSALASRNSLSRIDHP